MPNHTKKNICPSPALERCGTALKAARRIDPNRNILDVVIWSQPSCTNSDEFKQSFTALLSVFPLLFSFACYWSVQLAAEYVSSQESGMGKSIISSKCKLKNYFSSECAIKCQLIRKGWAVWGTCSSSPPWIFVRVLCSKREILPEI